MVSRTRRFDHLSRRNLGLFGFKRIVLMIFISVSIDTACGAMTFAKRLRPFVDGALAGALDAPGAGRFLLGLAVVLAAPLEVPGPVPMLI